MPTHDETVLDPFGGSGSTLIAAERTGRCARLIEFDPLYCDQIVRRYEALTGKQAVLMGTRMSFEAMGEQRVQGSQQPIQAPHAQRPAQPRDEETVR